MRAQKNSPRGEWADEKTLDCTVSSACGIVCPSVIFVLFTCALLLI